MGLRRATYDGRGVHSVERRIYGARAHARSSRPRADGCSVVAMREEDGRAGRKDRIYLSAAPRIPFPKVISDFQLGARGGHLRTWDTRTHMDTYLPLFTLHTSALRSHDRQPDRQGGRQLCLGLCNARGPLDKPPSHPIPPTVPGTCRLEGGGWGLLVGPSRQPVRRARRPRTVKLLPTYRLTGVGYIPPTYFTLVPAPGARIRDLVYGLDGIGRIRM